MEGWKKEGAGPRSTSMIPPPKGDAKGFALAHRINDLSRMRIVKDIDLDTSQPAPCQVGLGVGMRRATWALGRISASEGGGRARYQSVAQRRSLWACAAPSVKWVAPKYTDAYPSPTSTSVMRRCTVPGPAMISRSSGVRVAGISVMLCAERPSTQKTPSSQASSQKQRRRARVDRPRVRCGAR